MTEQDILTLRDYNQRLKDALDEFSAGEYYELYGAVAVMTRLLGDYTDYLTEKYITRMERY